MNHLTFDELKEGTEYSIYCKPFDVSNDARLISFDTTGLNRPIAYFQFTSRNYKPINKEQLKLMFKNDTYPHTVFALWDFDLENNFITKLKK